MFGGRGLRSFISSEYKQMAKRKHNAGYLSACFRKDGRYYYEMIHRLVLLTYIGQCPDGMECCHKDGNKLNNSLDNLYWGTRQKNMEDSVKNNSVAFGDRNYQTKLTEEQVKKILVLLSGGMSQNKIGQIFGVSQTAISFIKRGINWRRTTENQKINVSE